MSDFIWTLGPTLRFISKQRSTIMWKPVPKYIFKLTLAAVFHANSGFSFKHYSKSEELYFADPGFRSEHIWEILVWYIGDRGFTFTTVLETSVQIILLTRFQTLFTLETGVQYMFDDPLQPMDIQYVASSSNHLLQIYVQKNPLLLTQREENPKTLKGQIYNDSVPLKKD